MEHLTCRHRFTNAWRGLFNMEVSGGMPVVLIEIEVAMKAPAALVG